MNIIFSSTVGFIGLAILAVLITRLVQVSIKRVIIVVIAIFVTVKLIKVIIKLIKTAMYWVMFKNSIIKS